MCIKKLSWKNFNEAMNGLERLRDRASRGEWTIGRVPIRVYFCDEHKRYHVTSRPWNNIKRRKPMTSESFGWFDDNLEVTVLAELEKIL
jgi:hypothetical protein